MAGEDLSKLSKGGQMSYWWVSSKGRINNASRSGENYELRRAFGDCFRTKRQAELAKKRIKKVFERIKR